VIVVGLSLLVGCANTGRPIDNNKVTTLQKGVTTRSQVEQAFGPPDNVTLSDNGGHVLTYAHAEEKPDASMYIPVYDIWAGSTEISRQQLQIIVDKNDVVQNYEFKAYEGQTTGGMNATYAEHEVPTTAPTTAPTTQPAK
jgi:hypothetical protein